MAMSTTDFRIVSVTEWPGIETGIRNNKQMLFMLTTKAVIVLERSVDNSYAEPISMKFAEYEPTSTAPSVSKMDARMYACTIVTA